MTPVQALKFIRKHGVVMERARGPVPSLAEEIAGGRIAGSWWAHEKAQEIFSILQAVQSSNEVMACRLIQGKIALVHRTRRASIVRLASKLPAHKTAIIVQRHLASGHHEVEEIPLRRWRTDEDRRRARGMTIQQAEESLGSWIHNEYARGSGTTGHQKMDNVEKSARKERR